MLDRGEHVRAPHRAGDDLRSADIHADDDGLGFRLRAHPPSWREPETGDG
jgi:hypothetical protein